MLQPPLFYDAQLNSVLNKLKELLRLSERLALIPAQDALFVLRYVIQASSINTFSVAYRFEPMDVAVQRRRSGGG